jgi:hypothetical protein
VEVHPVSPQLAVDLGRIVEEFIAAWRETSDNVSTL